MIKALAIILAALVQTEELPRYELPEVVVTATRLSLPADASPWPVEVLEVEENEVTDLTDVLSQSISADVRSYGYEGHSAFPILGGILASRVLVLANGVHMNSRRDGVMDLSLIPMAPGDRVEVVKGPLSALYGSAAIGGVVNVIPSRKDRLAASFGTTDQLGVNTGVCATHNFGIFGARATSSYLTNPGFRRNDDVTRYNCGIGFWIAPTDAFNIELNTGYTWREMGVPGPLPDTADTAFVPPTYGDSLVTSLYDREEDGLLTLNLKSTFSPSGNYSHTLNLYLVNQDFTYTWPSLSNSGDIELTSSNYKDVRIGGDFQFSVDVRDFLIWASGVSAESEKLKANWDGQDNHLGVWTELLAQLGIFTPSAAARLEYSGAYGHFFSPELGLSVVPIPQKFKISAAYGRSFRAPTLNDLFWPADEYSQGNPDLVPEKSQSVVLSADAKPFRSLRLTAAGSWKDINDMISWLPFQGSVWRPDNVDQVTIWGAELSTEWRIVDDLLTGSVGLVYNYAYESREIIDSVWYDDDFVPHYVTHTVSRQAAFIPPLILKGNMAIHAWSGGQVSVDASRTGQRINYYPDYSPYPDIGVLEKTIDPSLKIDLAVSQKFFKLLSLEVGVKNVLNDRTPAHFGNYNDLDYPTAPRRFYGALSVTY